MTDPTLVLYHFPNACSQVSMCALEMAQLDYRVELVNLAANAQTEPAYMAISPLGKIPLLTVDGVSLSENAAILTYIAALRPDTGIFPPDQSPLARAEAVGGLSFCSATLHPQVRGLANPARLTTGDSEPVRERSRLLAAKSFAMAERRLAERDWWLGTVSIVDVYLNWAFTVARNAKFDTSAYLLLEGLATRLEAATPAFVRMQSANAAARVQLGLPS